ncbi:hypothetical protein PFISCL1PPCAC_13711 [Pristionchus fissidentatus]|uniref:Uncharacterized protein n=1 Tax=Pristionchus fissidentatus TaxID=1538716 RepID=A0AAV5VS69_9BILA|nr:hypothetical protein PFISCL1PPCAC_13711 [Pristionchus fissidentatus]
MSSSEEMKEVSNSDDVSLKNSPPLPSDDDEIAEDPILSHRPLFSSDVDGTASDVPSGSNNDDISLNPPLHKSIASSSTAQGPIPTMMISCRSDEATGEEKQREIRKKYPVLRDFWR